MNDRYYMQNLLTCAKSMCGLLLHGTVESSTPNVNTTMNQALFECLSLQNAIYKQMEMKGWYKVEAVPQTKIAQTATTIANS